MNKRDDDILKIKQMALRMRKHALNMALAAGAHSSHFGGGVSVIDIVATLYGAIMRYNVGQPEWGERDRFILSKGHGVLGYYAALADVGFVPVVDLLTFEKDGSYLAGHPVMNRAKGIEFSNGSLGMGLSLGVGVCLAGYRRNKNYRVFVLLGDGECNEGAVWEAAMATAHFKLGRLVAIIDRNAYQLGGKTGDVMDVGDLAMKWKSFGWRTVEVDGHDIGQLYDVFACVSDDGSPLAVIANTVKGKGFAFAENNNAWHHAVLTKSQYEMALAALCKQEEPSL